MKTKDMLKDETIVGSPVKHLVVLACVLFAFWLLLSGRFEFKFLFYGVLTAIVSAWICVPLLLLSNVDGTKKYFIFILTCFMAYDIIYIIIDDILK